MPRDYYGDYTRGRDREREDALADMNASLYEGDRRSRHVANETRIRQLDRLESEEREMHRRIQDLRDKERDYEERLRERREMLDEMGDKHLMADEAVALKKRDLKDLKLEEHERRARLEDLQRAREDMSDLLGRKRDQLARLDEEGNRARAVLSSTKQELRTYREDIAKLGEYERRLRSEISEQREAIRSFREDEARSEEHLHRLARETEMAEREFGSLSHEVRRLDEIDRQVRGDLEHRRHRIEELAHLERQYTRELDHLAHTRVDYSHAVEKLMSVEDRQRHELARSADELHRLERRLTHDPYMPGPGHYGMPPPPPLTGAAFGGPRAYPAITGPIGYAPTTPFVGSRVIATPARGTAVVGTSQVQTQQR